MLYYLFEYLEKQYQFPGATLFQFQTFRAAMAILFSLILATVFGKKIILFLKKKQIGESVRDLGLEGQQQKEGTPTMGGLIIIMSTLIPVLLFAKLENIYVMLLIVTTIWMGIIGFVDDYIKIFRNNKRGLKGRFKVLGQVVLGLMVGATLFFHPEVTMKEKNRTIITAQYTVEEVEGEAVKSIKTNVPFFKNNELDYTDFISWIGEGTEKYAWLLFIPIVIFIITAVSNGANLTDGIDGLAAGTSAIIVLTLGIFAYVSDNIIFSEYLDIFLYPKCRGTYSFHCCLCRSFGWFSMVQCFSCTGVYGRYRKSHHRGSNSRNCNHSAERIAYPTALRNLLCRVAIGNDAGKLFQIHQEKTGRRETDLPYVSTAPSLPEERVS